MFELEICNETVPDLDTAKTEFDKILDYDDEILHNWYFTYSYYFIIL